MKKRGIFRKYLLGAGILIFLVCGAFGLPHFFFYMEDGYRDNTYSYEKREESDISKLNINYEKDDYTRLSSFADGLNHGKKYYVTATDYENRGELQKIIQNLFFNNAMLDSWTINNFFPSDMYSGTDFTVNSSKRFVVYEEDMSQGVQFLLWYVDVVFYNGSNLKLIVDDETKLVYYCEVIFDEKRHDDELKRDLYIDSLAQIYESYQYDPEWVYGSMCFAGIYYGIERYKAAELIMDSYNVSVSFTTTEWLNIAGELDKNERDRVNELLKKYEYFEQYYIPSAETCLRLGFENAGLDWVNMLYQEQVNGEDKYHFYVGLRDVKNLLQAGTERHEDYYE